MCAFVLPETRESHFQPCAYLDMLRAAQGDIEVQGDHVARVEAFLVKKGCIKGVSRVNQAAALPTSNSRQAEKSVARLDRKAAELKQKQRGDSHQPPLPPQFSPPLPRRTSPRRICKSSIFAPLAHRSSYIHHLDHPSPKIHLPLYPPSSVIHSLRQLPSTSRQPTARGPFLTV